MIAFLAALVAVATPFTTFDRQQRDCERRFAGSDFAEYGACVTQAGEREQRQFKRLISVAINDRRISSAKFRAWAESRNRKCHKVWQSGLNINAIPILEARCIASADDKLLKFLQMKHH